MHSRGIQKEDIGTLAFFMMWVGTWGSWVPSSHAAGLSQNAFYLAEWSTFLPEVRFGSSGYTPDVLRLSVALVSVMLVASSWTIQEPIIRLVIITLALLPGLILLPPYPDVLSLWWSPSYGRRFIVAAILWLGALASPAITFLPRRLKLKPSLLIALTLATVMLAGWSFWELSAFFATRYAEAIMPGWGLLLFLTGAGLAITTQLLIFLRKDAQTDITSSAK